MAKTREDLIAKWWEGWWAEDFSWAGLAEKPIGRHGGLHDEQTLQEYWRRDPATGARRDDAALEAAGELIRDPDGALWHVVHVPLRWRGGKAAKAGWDEGRAEAFGWVVEGRVAAAAETGVDINCNATGPDGRAQLAGAVLLTAPLSPLGDEASLHLHCDWAWLPSWRAEGQRFGRGFRCAWGIFSGFFRFERATFSGHSSFLRANFAGDARFGSATFSEDSSFLGATFSGDAGFARATFSGQASFRGATFSGNATFDSATLSADAGFDVATFAGMASFHNATFSRRGATFAGATFSGDAMFDSAVFSGHASFVGASFAGNASFDRADISGHAGFLSATFFRWATFRSATFLTSVAFEHATFSGDAKFDSAAFSGGAYFDQAEFAKPVSFDGGAFGAKPPRGHGGTIVRFHRTTFAGPVSFRGRTFHARMDFTAATFVRQAWFTGITWPKAAADWHAAFDQAVFRDVASFRGSGFRCFAAFDGASFGGGLQLDDTDETDADRQFRAELEQARAMNGATPPIGWLPSARIAAWLAGGVPAGSDASQAPLKQLERGCRVLKQAMEKASHKTREQILHAFELQARRSQRDTPWWEKVVSDLYKHASDYGRSIIRPLRWLGGSIVAFWAVYFFMAGGGAVEALLYSLGRVFPFGAFTVSDSEWEKALIGASGLGWKNAAVRGLATAQSVLALILIFLSLLAIRRRFQIT